MLCIRTALVWESIPGQSEYNPIAAEVQRKTGTGDIPFKDIVKTDTGYATRTPKMEACRRDNKCDGTSHSYCRASFSR